MSTELDFDSGSSNDASPDRRATVRMRDSLRPSGYLVIDMMETLPKACRDAFDGVDTQHRIYRRV